MPVKHVLSRELQVNHAVCFYYYILNFALTMPKLILLLQLYFNKITELAVSMPDSVLFKEALTSLSTDSGLHPLVPYFTCFIEDEVLASLNFF